MDTNNSKDIWVFVETPMGSRVKYEYDAKVGMLALDRVLPPGLAYPANYGFIPSSRAQDGAPLDVLLLSTYPVAAGVVVRARAVGVFEFGEEGGEDSKIIAVPAYANDPIYAASRDMAHIPVHMHALIEKFFQKYRAPEEKPVAGHFSGVRSAEALIQKAQRGMVIITL